MKKKYKNYFVRSLIGDIRYMLCSYRFLAAVVGYTVISFISLLDEMKLFPGASVYYLYMVYYSYPFWLLFLLFAVFPGGKSFCEDFESRYYRYRILRFGKRNYAVSKAISCFISAFVLVFLSQWLLIGVLTLRGPMYLDVDKSAMPGGIYAVLMNENQIWIYFMIRILILAAGAGFFSIVALWISTKIVNIFVVLASPIIVYYLIDNVSVALGIPFYLSLSRIIRSTIEIKGEIGVSLLYALGIFGGLSVAFMIAFYFGCRKRCEDG
ncbi:MAG: hypothetical protein PHG16_06865 [Lachnospiraceae bacterium]|nr:hypothetical protein [Lachnospiraceae bacterium]